MASLPVAEAPTGSCHRGPYVSFRFSTALLLNTLYTSRFACTCARAPVRKILLSRRSNCVRRGLYNVFGGTSGTAAVARHTACVPHAARLRPSEGAISALVAL